MTADIAIWSAKRVFFLGVNTGFVTDGQPDDRYVDFYRQRSSNHLYCAIVGNVVVPRGYGSNNSTAFIGRNTAWAQVASAISEKGSVPGIQLATAWEGYEGARKFLSADRDKVVRQARALVQQIGRSGLESVLTAFEMAAVIAVDHGFRHIQFHGAHGYLLNLLLDERINSDAGRVQDGLSKISTGLRERGVETSLRISMRTGDLDFDAGDTERRQDALFTLPFDYFDLSSGFYNINKRLIYPSLQDVMAERLSDSLDIVRRRPLQQFIVSGRIAEQASDLPNNAQVGICRDLIANPKFLDELNNGCRNHGKCHYYSRGEEFITCQLWEESRTSSRK